MNTFALNPDLPEAARTLIQAIGQTPLIELFPSGLPKHSRFFAKMEGCNPGGSIKDRPVARMLIAAWKQQRFSNGQRLLDASSGNAGISYAMLGAAMKIPVTIVVPGNASQERLHRIRAHGAELVTTDPLEGYDFALKEAQRLAQSFPEKYAYMNQYGNEQNWKAHYDSTATEILTQLAQQYHIQHIDVLVAGVGTGGTITGVGRRLRKSFPHLHIASIIPERFPGIEGLKPLTQPEDIVPEILDFSIINEQPDVALDDAIQQTHQLAQQGLFVGPSSGAYVQAGVELAKTHHFPVIVSVLSDSGERYHSTDLWRKPAL
jgi:S-sulfo-L-cysteine synthase (O-acetyl-L-serine-dependent)